MTLAIHKDGACTKALIMDITTYLLVKLYQSKGYKNYFKVCQLCASFNPFSEQGSIIGERALSVVLTCNAVLHPSLVAYEDSSLVKRLVSSALIYLIAYAILFCSSGGGGGNHKNNDGNGHKRSRYNCCDDDGCTKVKQCCKFETKTKLKLA